MHTQGFRCAVYVIAVGIFFLAFGAMAADYSGGAGTEENPYQIGSVEDWTTLAATAADFDKHFVLIADIDFEGNPITPVGTVSPRFNGVFDGKGHVLRNGYIDFPSTSYIGVFPCLGANAAINNLGVEEVEITGKDYVGCLVGYNLGAPVTNCYATGAVSGENYVGGLVGYNEIGSTITGCYATGEVTGTGDEVGGLVGRNYGSGATESYATGAVSGNKYVGGLAGCGGTYISCFANGNVNGNDNEIGGLLGRLYEGAVAACHASGSVTGAMSSVFLGGLVGFNYAGTVTGSSAMGVVTGGGYIGGLVGYNEEEATVTVSYATGEVLTTSSSSYAGGLMGYNNGTVSSSYATGGVSGISYTGGLVGYVYAGGIVTSCYSTGAVTSTSTKVGGLVGYRQSSSTVTSSYWDIDTSGRSTSAGGEGRRTIEMTYPSAGNTYVGWDFASIWVADTSSTINNGYPYLLNCTACMGDEDCDDGDSCTHDTCHPVSGICVFTPISCDDGIACTVDSCDPAIGCVFTPDHTRCGDSDACNGLETCDPIAGCQPGVPLECDDGIECTVDTCDPSTGCVYTPDNTLCNDENLATIDICDPDLGCIYEDIDCSDGDACTIDILDPVYGCVYEAVDCDDQDACTIDTCDFVAGCEYALVDCDDGDLCTTDDCDPATGCVHTSIDCNDENLCTIDSCDPASGCVFTPVNCDDGDPTTEDTCDPATGECIHTPLPVPHPADANEDFQIELSEAIAYLSGWQQGSNAMAYAIRAAYLWQNGEGYVYDAGQAPPMCWVLAN